MSTSESEPRGLGEPSRRERGIVWVEGPLEDLPGLLEANLGEMPLRVVIARHISRESKLIQFHRTPSNRRNIILSDYLAIPRMVCDISDLYQCMQQEDSIQNLKRILVTDFSRGQSSPEEGVRLLFEKAVEAIEIFRHDVVSSVVVRDHFSLVDIEYLASNLRNVKFLRQDPTGFNLVDDLVNNRNFQGADQAAKRYKYIYHLLVENGAKSD